MRVKVIIRHYQEGRRVQVGEILELADLEALDLIALGYVEKVRKNAPLSPGQTPPNTDFAGGGKDRMIKTKGV